MAKSHNVQHVHTYIAIVCVLLLPEIILIKLLSYQLDSINYVIIMSKAQNKGFALPRHIKLRNKTCLTINFSQPKRYKKTNIFPALNRFALINTDEKYVFDIPSTITTEDWDWSPHTYHSVGPLDPPIHINNTSNFSAFNTVLKNITN